LKKAHVEVLVIGGGQDGQVSLRSLMKELGRRGVLSILLEGGPTLNASALQERVVDRILLFLAPKIIGGKEAPGMIGGKGVLRVKDARRTEILKARRLGPDLVIEGRLT
jgi:diaminohydroxyphosphoribosylaminopyrimidine deaminase/5-amino-6-(5-phosphoribosylamino)uracil reductase